MSTFNAVMELIRGELNSYSIFLIDLGTIVHEYLFLLIALLATPSIASAELVKWVDANGKVHYSNSRPANAKRSTILDIQPAPRVSRVEESTDSPETVDLYTTSWCPYCAKARAYLRANNIPFIDHDIEKDVNAAQRKRQLDSSYSGVPLAVINGKLVRGFSENNYYRALSD